MRRTWMLAGLACLSILVVGCEQMTPFWQQTPTTTEQGAATQGSSVTINVQNTTDPSGSTTESMGSNGILNDYYASAEPDPTRTNAAYVQHGISIVVTTGGTTPTLSGTTSGSAAQTGTPTQDVRPRLSAAIPIAVAPAGIADVSGSAGAGEGAISSEKTSDNALQWAELTGMEPDRVEAAFEFLNALFGTGPPGTNVPAAPTGTDGGIGDVNTNGQADGS